MNNNNNKTSQNQFCNKSLIFLTKFYLLQITPQVSTSGMEKLQKYLAATDSPEVEIYNLKETIQELNKLNTTLQNKNQELLETQSGYNKQIQELKQALIKETESQINTKSHMLIKIKFFLIGAIIITIIYGIIIIFYKLIIKLSSKNTSSKLITKDIVDKQDNKNLDLLTMQ